MSLTMADFRNGLEKAVNEATSFADLVDKYAQIAAQFKAEIPGGAGADVAIGAALINDVDAALHALQAGLNS